jgi:hypothetical protein
VSGPWRTRYPIAAVIIAIILGSTGWPRSPILAASMTGSAVSSSCVPCQNGVPSGKKFCIQWPSFCCCPARYVSNRAASSVWPSASRANPVSTASRGQTKWYPPGLLVVSPHGMVRPATIAPG